jgi:hypothetical protein
VKGAATRSSVKGGKAAEVESMRRLTASEARKTTMSGEGGNDEPSCSPPVGNHAARAPSGPACRMWNQMGACQPCGWQVKNGKVGDEGCGVVDTLSSSHRGTFANL